MRCMRAFVRSSSACARACNAPGSAGGPALAAPLGDAPAAASQPETPASVASGAQWAVAVAAAEAALLSAVAVEGGAAAAASAASSPPPRMRNGAKAASTDVTSLMPPNSASSGSPHEAAQASALAVGRISADSCKQSRNIHQAKLRLAHASGLAAVTPLPRSSTSRADQPGSCVLSRTETRLGCAAVNGEVNPSVGGGGRDVIDDEAQSEAGCW